MEWLKALWDEILNAGLDDWVAWVLYGFLALYSVAALALILERLLVWRGIKRKGRQLSQRLEGMLAQPDRQQLQKVFGGSDAPLGQVMTHVLKHGVRESPETTLLLLDDALEEVGSGFRRRLVSLAALAGTAPFLGLLGTVMGIIFTFQAIAREKMMSPAVISHGIAMALNTTAAGLIIAIPSFIAYNFFVGRTNNALQRLRMQANRIFVALGDL